MLDELTWIQNVPGVIKNVRALLSGTAGINDRIRNKLSNTGKLNKHMKCLVTLCCDQKQCLTVFLNSMFRSLCYHLFQSHM